MLRRRLLLEAGRLLSRLHVVDSSRDIAFGSRRLASSSQETSTSSSKSYQSVPTLIKVLGFGGVVPFWACSAPIASWLEENNVISISNWFGGTVSASQVQLAYGATIISFLGGVHWGIAMTNLTPVNHLRQRYVWSVMPSLLVWPTLSFPDVEHAAGVQAALLGLVYMVDRGWYRRGGFPPWYMQLRLPLTVLAAAGCLLTAASKPRAKNISALEESNAA
jgi:hypothetical protein